MGMHFSIGRWWRASGLRILFGIALFLLIVLALLQATGWAESLTGPQAGLALLAAVAASIFVTGMLGRRWPGFLRLPESVSLIRFMSRLLGASLLSWVVVTAVTAGLTWLTTDLDPSHSQYGVDIFFAAMFLPPFIAPLPAVLLTWYGLRQPG